MSTAKSTLSRTEDRMNNPPQNLQTAAAQLGWWIHHHRSMRNLSQQEVAQRCGCAVGLIERIERGEEVPSHAIWHRLVNMCFNRLGQEASLFRRAKEEEGNHRHLSVSLGDKLAKAKVQVAPASAPAAPAAPAPAPAPAPAAPASAPAPAAPRGRRPPPPGMIPPGARTTEERAKRLDAAEEIIRENPNMSSTRIREELKRRFNGVSVRPEAIERIRADHKRKLGNAQARLAAVEAPRSPAPRAPAPAPRAPERRREPDVSAAVGLLLDEIPNLASMTISVNEAGEVSVDFTTREQVMVVKEKSGSLKINRT